MSDLLFNRICVVSVRQQPPGNTFFIEPTNATEIRDLRMRFEIKKTLKPEPNTCTITISNLADRVRAQFRKRPITVSIAAGYADNPRLLFKGDVLPGSFSKQSDTNYDTVLYLGDGVRAFSNARISKSYAPGTPLRAVLRDAAASLNLHLPTEFDTLPLLQTKLVSGEVVHGFSSDELTRLLSPLGFDWSIQNGKLQILNSTQASTEAIRVIDKDHGMIGSPSIKIDEKQKDPPTIQVKSKLFPELIPGARIRVEARETKGMFKVIQTIHKGDTRGDDWHTEIEGHPV